MQTVYFFTHITMAGAALSVLYKAFEVEFRQTDIYRQVPGILGKCRALGCITKTRVIALSDQVARLKIPLRLMRRID